MYKQCRLKLVNSDKIHHAWIPTEFAIKGKIIQIKSKDGFWGKGAYEVISAGQVGVSGEYVRELERDHLHQRKASDI